MKKKYTHLTQEERGQMSVLHARQTSVSEIAATQKMLLRLAMTFCFSEKYGH